MKGRTSAGRLRALDVFVLERERRLIAAQSEAPFVDVGFGDRPLTTLESAVALREVNPELVVLGVEADVQRALAAAPFEALPKTRFVRGDFGVLSLLPKARVLRVMNVLRSHREEQVPAIHALLGQALVEGGVALEGSADEAGDILTAHVLRREGDALKREALLFFTRFTHGFAPALFRDWLPRDVRRRCRPGEWVHDFFGRWTRVWESTRTADAQESFVASVNALRQSGEPVELAAEGMMIWRPAAGVPA